MSSDEAVSGESVTLDDQLADAREVAERLAKRIDVRNTKANLAALHDLTRGLAALADTARRAGVNLASPVEQAKVAIRNQDQRLTELRRWQLAHDPAAVPEMVPSGGDRQSP